MVREEEIVARARQAIEENRKVDVAVRVTDAQGKPLAGIPVVAELSRHEFLFGCNIYMFDRFASAQENDVYKERFRALFNYATTGFYWRWYEQVRGKPAYAYTDAVVAWCAKHHIRVKGHPLLWALDSGIPPWSDGQPPVEVRKQRVTEIMTRYAGRIVAWEVVNEPAHLSGLAIDEPYRWAREADPTAYLIVNDYGVLADGCPAFFSLLEKAIADGVPFEGIGIQAHEPRTMRFPLDRVQTILDRYATLGKELHITEFTPASNGEEITGSHITGTWDEAAQADYAAKFYTVCFAHPAVVAITWWDLCDRGSWLKGGGLLREDLSPKPAYEALMDRIHRQWTTKVEAVTDADGIFSFRGFRGAYSVKVGRGGKTVEQSFIVGGKGARSVSVAVSLLSGTT